MKKFTRILICLVLCVFGIGLIGCGDDRTPEEKAFAYPGANDLVSGNGGLAVSKGNYIYFVNGFKEAKSSERYGSFMHGGVMLAKLSASGELVVEDDGELEDDNLIHISNKLAGFEATDLAIFGDYLYFTSVCQEDDAETELWANDIVDFNRIKLNKSGDVERIYQSTSNNQNVEFKYYQENGSVSLLVYEKDSEELVRINTNKDKTIVASGVKNVYFSENCNEVFYVLSTGNSKAPYKSYKLNAVSGSISEFVSHASQPTVKFVENGKVYILEDDNLNVYDTETKIDEGCAISGVSSYSSVNVAPNGDALIAISTEGDGLIFEFYENGVPVTSYQETGSEATVLGYANGSVVYIDADKNIKSLSYANQNTIPVTIAKISDINTSYIDVDGSYMYFFKKVGNNEYLHRLLLDNGAQVEEFVGVYLDTDEPADED